MRFIYIGEDSDETRTRIERIEELRMTAKDRQVEQSRLVRLLRAEGMTPTDRATGSILSAMAATGTFRLGGTIVGTNAFRLYEGELGLRLPLGGMANTGDIDIAQFEKLSLALQDQVDPGLAETFSALNYLNFLIAKPIPAAALYRSGILVQVPRPERYAIHKLIIAERRRDGASSLKSAKDREQAAFLIEAMAEDRPDDLAKAYMTALEVGPRWRERIGNSLKRMPETKSILESLCAQ